MENETKQSFEKKIENKFDKWFSDFEKNPITTGIKAVIILWIVKKVYQWFKGI